MANRHLILDLPNLHSPRLHERRDPLLDCAVYSLKVDDDIIAFERQILQDRRYARCRILHEDAFASGHI
jgi:hypothetical protein